MEVGQAVSGSLRDDLVYLRDVNSYVHFGQKTDVVNDFEPTEIESDDDVQFMSIMDLPLLY